jgi:hypothetical protein
MHEMIRCTRPHMASGVWHDAAAGAGGYRIYVRPGTPGRQWPLAAMNARCRCKVQEGRRRTNMPSALPCPVHPEIERVASEMEPAACTAGMAWERKEKRPQSSSGAEVGPVQLRGRRSKHCDCERAGRAHMARHAKIPHHLAEKKHACGGRWMGR